jgi:ketosteroid isomerase-like protein
MRNVGIFAARLLMGTWFLFLLPSAGVEAQIPGGQTVDVDLEAAKFKAFILEQVRPVLESWQDAWRGQGTGSLESHYTADAVLAAPGGVLVGGREPIAQYARSMRLAGRSLSASMLDLDPSEKLACVYGTWAAPGAVGEAATGRHVTVLAKIDGQWMIRSQLFSADAAAANPFPGIARPEPLPALATRITPDSTTGRKSVAPMVRETQKGISAGRRRAYLQLATTMASFRRAWAGGDAKGMTELLHDAARVQFPGLSPIAGDVSREDMDVVLAGYGPLNSVEVDFEMSGSLAWLSGRYYVERPSGGARSGNYIAVFRNRGSGWRIRVLVFG